MRIADAYKRGKPVFSFEFFPPRNEEGRPRSPGTGSRISTGYLRAGGSAGGASNTAAYSLTDAPRRYGWIQWTV